MRLQDKVIAITGSGSGLGREAALLFSAEGAQIVTSDVVTGRAQRVAQEVIDAGARQCGSTPTCGSRRTWSVSSRRRSNGSVGWT